MDRLLDMQEVGQILGVVKETVRTMIQKKILPAINIGSAKSKIYRIRQSDLEAFLESRKVH